jgi:mannose-6-phosphate isomerase-like protein (cupin superfamily)
MSFVERVIFDTSTLISGVGDSIAIPPGTPHCLENKGSQALHILCCCAPAYSHDDTELL